MKANLSARAINCLEQSGIYEISPISVRKAIEEKKIAANQRMVGSTTWKEIKSFACVLNEPAKLPCNGMSLRDWFAGMALGHIPALLDVSDENASCENIAGHAYQIADAMLAARDRKEVAS